MNLGHLEKLQRIQLADLLVEEGVLDRATVEDAQNQQDAEGKQLGEVLVQREILTDYDLAKLLATRAAWRVLWSIWRTGRYEAAKTDRVTARRTAHLPLSSGERVG